VYLEVTLLTLDSAALLGSARMHGTFMALSLIQLLDTIIREIGGDMRERKTLNRLSA
jgi:hypothetical protein